MTITLQGTNLKLTDELRSFLEEKLQDGFRALGDMNLDPVQVDVELERTTRRHPHERKNESLYRAEVNVYLPGRLIRVEASANEMHQAIFQMKHTLTRKLRKWHGRVIDSTRKGARAAMALPAEVGLEAREALDLENGWTGWEEEQTHLEEKTAESGEQEGDDLRDFV